MIARLVRDLIDHLRKIVSVFIKRRSRVSRLDTPSSSDRTVRLFVSSTFQDMQNERRVLQSEVLPVVRRFLWDRGVAFVAIDLRWGVTREEAERGEVLEICLKEIDRCRPWLLGMFGDRYGWIDPDARKRLSSDPQFSRLVPHAGVSVTELEMRHAITDRPDEAPAPAALLYWRTERVAETPFKSLVADLAASGATVRPGGPDLASFVNAVRDDLIASLTERMAGQHALSQAQSLARNCMAEGRDAFVDRPETARLTRRTGAGAGLVALIGAEGCGKSAVMRALGRAVEAEGRTKLVAAFAPGGFRTWTAAFKSIIAQLGDSGAATRGSGALTQRFHAVAAAAAALSALCVLIDDIDGDPASSDELAWLPDRVSDAMIVVALRGGDREAVLAKARGYRVVTLGAPTPAQTREMFERSLIASARRLDKKHLDRILASRRNARGCLIVSEEIRQTQRFEDLDAAVTELAALTSPAELADRALARIVAGDRWKSDVLLALAASELGLSDEPMQQIARDCGGRGAPLDLCLLREAIGTYAADVFGRTVLVNSAFRDAIFRSRTPEDAATARRTIMAACLERIDAPGSAEELIEQARSLGDWTAFAGFLARPDLAEALMRRAPEVFAAAWTEALSHDAPGPDEVYGAWAGVETPERLALAAEFLIRRGLSASAERLAADALERGGDGPPEVSVRGHSVLARVRETAGRLDEAERHCRAVADVASGVEAARALAAANALRLTFLRDGAGAIAGPLADARARALAHPDGRALATVTLVQGLAALDAHEHAAARGHFEDLKRMSLRDDDLAGSAAAEAGLARCDFLRGRRRQAERRARTIVAIGELLDDVRIRIEGLAISTAVATDDVRRFGEARATIAERRRIAMGAGDQIALIEADMDEAILMAGHGPLGEMARERAQGAAARAATLGLRRLEESIRRLL